MQILVTGGTGFIGRRLMKRLVRTHGPDEITCLIYNKEDNEVERTGRAALKELGIRTIPVDLVTGEGLELVPKLPDAVLHLASNTDTGSSDHRVNDVGTKNLLNAISPLKEGFRFVFTSTISVSDHRKEPNAPGNETSELLRPYSEYGRRKLQTEGYLKERCQKDGFSLSILRVCAAYGNGTRQKGLYDSLVTFAKRDSILGRFNYPGRMTMMHVDDIADILAELTDKPADPGNPAIYIADAEVLSIHEMCADIYEALGKPFRPITLPRWFWWCTQRVSPIIYALEPVLPHGIHNKLWQLTLLVNNGYNNESVRLKQAFPNKTFILFKDGARDLVADE
jgi:nucleoside-diphosphate-sugar epimerase